MRMKSNGEKLKTYFTFLLLFFQKVLQYNLWGCSLAGKALRSQRRDRGFESRHLHENETYAGNLIF